MAGRLIVLEGGDASGKTTQFELLRHRLGSRVKTVSFPRYGEPSAALLQEYLSGAYGTSPDSVNPYTASTFFAIDRAASFLTDWSKPYYAGEAILAYRYTTSNAIYAAAKLPPDEWPAFWAWLHDYEYHKLGLPKPDCVFFLDMPQDITRTLLADRGSGDIHEAVLEYQTRCHAAADAACKHHRWRRVFCAPDGALRTIEAINDELYGLITECFHLPK
jgi:dTMP kinase